MKRRNWRRYSGWYKPPATPRYPDPNRPWRYKTPSLRRAAHDWNAYIDHDYRAWFYQRHGRDLPADLLQKVLRRRLRGKARRPPLKVDDMRNDGLEALAERVLCAEREYKVSDQSARVKLGRVWLEAHLEFEATGVGTWKDWVTEHGDGRSLRDVRRLIALANDADPEAKAADERSSARARMQNHRAAPKPPSAQAAIEASKPAPEQPTWDGAPAMPAPAAAKPSLVALPSAPDEAERDRLIHSLLVSLSDRLIHSLLVSLSHKLGHAACVPFGRPDSVDVVRRIMTALELTIADLEVTDQAIEPPIAAPQPVTLAITPELVAEIDREIASMPLPARSPAAPIAATVEVIEPEDGTGADTMLAEPKVAALIPIDLEAVRAALRAEGDVNAAYKRLAARLDTGLSGLRQILDKTRGHPELHERRRAVLRDYLAERAAI